MRMHVGTFAPEGEDTHALAKAGPDLDILVQPELVLARCCDVCLPHRVRRAGDERSHRSREPHLSSGPQRDRLAIGVSHADREAHRIVKHSEAKLTHDTHLAVVLEGHKPGTCAVAACSFASFAGQSTC